MNIPSFSGKKVNRILFFLFLSITCVVLAVTAIFSIFRNGSYEVSVLLVLSVITGVMACFYGIHWIYYVYRQKFMDRWFSEEEQDDGEEGPSEPACDIAEDFVLPREQLIEAARKRYRGIAKWIWIALAVVYLLITSILLYYDALKESSQLLYLAAFCILIAIPGLIVQFIIKAQYFSSVPENICLAPGLLTVDGREYKAGDIESLRVSRERSRDPHAVSVFRQLEIFSEDGKDLFRIDFGAGSDVEWDAYPYFVSLLSQWGSGNGVTVTVEDRD